MIQHITYDIAKDKTRTKFALRLEAIGFIRVQKSVFIGRVRQQSLLKLLKQYDNFFEEDDKLYILYLTPRQVREMYRKGFESDLELILGNRRSFFI